MSGPIEFSQAKLFAAMSGAQDEEPEEDEDAPEKPAARPVAKKKSTAVFETKNVLKLAKARLREVNKALKDKKALEQERDELQRLIKAATTTPRAASTDANVVPLKRTG